MRYPNPTPAHHLGRARDQARQAWRRPQRQGHARTFPFPNPEAKTASADGTAPARVWESRTPPPAHHKRGGPATGPPLFSRAPTHVRGHTATHAHGHAHTGHRETHHVRGHTRHGATHARPHAPQKPHTRQSSPHRTGSLSIGFGLGLSCGRMVLSVERGWACVGLLTASRALSALFAAEPLVSQSLDGPLSGRGCGSVVRVLTRV